MLVLKGAAKLVETYKPTLIVELLRKWMSAFGHKPQDFLDELARFGYSCFAFDGSSLSLIEEITASTSATNFVFVHPSRQKHVDIIFAASNL
jgi:hypothetical protein